jgi:hypothetical protein
MNRIYRDKGLQVVVAGVMACGVTLVACKSSSPKEKQAVEPGKQHVAAVTPPDSGTGPGIDLNCVYDHIVNPPESFHYSYKKISDYPVTQEADITPETIDGSFTNAGGTHPVHGVKSDQQSWSGALAGMTAVSGMSSTIAIVNHSSAMVKEGTEKVNGYDTVKYSIDTSRATTAEVGLYKATLGDGGFEKGEAWVTAQGCPVKLSLDSQSVLHNGQVDKQHYDIAMVLK